jgi:TetR/AcrR family transcriptional regulator, acrAB operon repressor
MKKTKEDAELTRKAVLKAAMKVFSKKGYTQTSLAEVAKEAGMTRGAIYWHFSNKHQLLSSVIDECDKEWEIMINNIINADTSPSQKIKTLISVFISLIVKKDQYRLMEEIMVFKTSSDSELQKLYLTHMENVKLFRQMLKDLVQEGIDTGEFESRFEAESIVVAMTSYIAGIKTAWLSDIVGMSIENYSLHEKAEELAELLIHGFAKR